MLFVKNAVITSLLIALIGACIASWVIVDGRFDVAVSAQLPQPIHDLIHQTRVNAVRREARGLQPPTVDFDDEASLVRAAARFQSMCADCHQPPGGAPSALAQGLNPQPADLNEVARMRSLEELVWVIQNGIRMSAMPAWGLSLDQAEVWALAALVSRFPQLSGTEFQALLSQADSGVHLSVAERALDPAEARL